MHVIGTFEDVTGFALAGGTGTVCADAHAVARALDEVCRDRTVAMVLISPGPAAGAGTAIDAWAGRRDAPIIVVLPEPDAADGSVRP